MFGHNVPESFSSLPESSQGVLRRSARRSIRRYVGIVQNYSLLGLAITAFSTKAIIGYEEARDNAPGPYETQVYSQAIGTDEQWLIGGATEAGLCLFVLGGLRYVARERMYAATEYLRSDPELAAKLHIDLGMRTAEAVEFVQPSVALPEE